VFHVSASPHDQKTFHHVEGAVGSDKTICDTPQSARRYSHERMTDIVADKIVDIDDIYLTLTSRAGPVEILRGVSLAIAPGQSTAIVGPSGSGKTSLLMIMAGLEAATRGKVAIKGHGISGLGEDALAVLRGEHIGIVFQSFHLVPTMTALENVALPLELAGVADAFTTARQLLGDVGLASRIDHFPAELSGGEQQRVAIARALSRKPALILADEPTGNLDGKTGKQIVDILFGLRERINATLVLVTHDERLAAMTDRIIRMSDGVIVADEIKRAAMRAVAP
jgi:putative ABC transport system ATP-binding protein